MILNDTILLYKKEWGVVMEKEKLKILEELRRILNNKNEAIIILNNYFKGGVGKSKLSTMFAYLTDKLNLKVLMIDKDLQATLTKGFCCKVLNLLSNKVE